MTINMHIAEVTQDSFNEWVDLAVQLWPDSSYEEMQETLAMVLTSVRQAAFLIKNNDQTAIGFINLSLRYDYVPGATQSPVAFVEGIYVVDAYRKQGIGAHLIRHAEQWAAKHGCIQLASDIQLDNTQSYQFHTQMGFQEVERTIAFIKPLNSSV